jgi:hypothetical protein
MPTALRGVPSLHPPGATAPRSGNCRYGSRNPELRADRVLATLCADRLRAAQSPDILEGQAARAEKRAPRFSGR